MHFFCASLVHMQTHMHAQSKQIDGVSPVADRRRKRHKFPVLWSTIMWTYLSSDCIFLHGNCKYRDTWFSLRSSGIMHCILLPERTVIMD